jgi:hypothetical protein
MFEKAGYNLTATFNLHKMVNWLRINAVRTGCFYTLIQVNIQGKNFLASVLQQTLAPDAEHLDKSIGWRTTRFGELNSGLL